MINNLIGLFKIHICLYVPRLSDYNFCTPWKPNLWCDFFRCELTALNLFNTIDSSNLLKISIFWELMAFILNWWNGAGTKRQYQLESKMRLLRQQLVMIMCRGHCFITVRAKVMKEHWKLVGDFLYFKCLLFKMNILWVLP